MSNVLVTINFGVDNLFFDIIRYIKSYKKITIRLSMIVKIEAALTRNGNESFIKIILGDYRISAKLYFLWGCKLVIGLFSYKDIYKM